MTRANNPQISFADLEFLHQSIQLDPILKAISGFVDRQPALVESVRADLVRGLKRPDTGRCGLTAEQVLRSLTLMRVKNWDYRELRERIADGYTLRRFTRFDSKLVPKHDAFNRSFNRLTPRTMAAINNMVVRAAVDLGIEDGHKLRVDTTVVETDIHRPTDSALLWDSVRVITRLVRRLEKMLPGRIGVFVNHTRFVRRRMQEIHRMTPTQRRDHSVTQYRKLIGMSVRVVSAARKVLDETRDVRGVDLITAVAIDALRREIAHYCDLADRVIDQARRRVIQGEQVPNDQKIFSIFETHTDLIMRGKPGKPVEFGHKVLIAESARGLITQYRVLPGNPSDQDHVKPSLEHHNQIFGAAPELYSADRGFYHKDNVESCIAAGVANVCIPQRGGKKTPERQTLEKSPAFKKGQRFRAGVEGRISVLFRGRGMKRCRSEGSDRFELLVGAAVLANNLMVIGRILDARRNRTKRAA